MKKHIPNFLTILNLVSGIVAIYLVLNNNPKLALIFFLLSVVFDFTDGFAARLLKAYSDLGKQLDSLADLVSFGLFSTAMVFTIIQSAITGPDNYAFSDLHFLDKAILISVLIIPVFSAIRLAKFNLLPDSDFFLGLPVPAYALFWAGIYFDINFNSGFFGRSLNSWFLFGVMLMTTIFMVIPLPMLSLKFRNLKIIENLGRYILILSSILILVFTGVSGLPLVILTYILLSLLRILLT